MKFILKDDEKTEEFHNLLRSEESPDECRKKAKEFVSSSGYGNKTYWNEWEERKAEVMKKAIEAKFEQNALLKEKLLETGEAKLIEANARDPYW